jgi:hypothetical protein
MSDDRTLFAAAQHIPAPDLWTEIAARAAEPSPAAAALPRRPRTRLVVAVVALVLSALAIGAAVGVLRPSEGERPAGPQRWREIDRIHVGRFAADVVALEGSLWVSSDRGLSRIDPSTGELSPPLEIERGALAASDRFVWVLGESGVTKVDVATGRSTLMPLPGTASGAIEAGFGAAWASQYKGQLIYRVDEATGDVTPIDTGQMWPIDLAVSSNAVWSASLDGVIQRIDPATNDIALSVDLRVAEADPTLVPMDVAVEDDSVWVTVCSGASLDRFGAFRRCAWSIVRLDGSTGTVAERVDIGVSEERPTAEGMRITFDRVGALVVADGSLWVAINDYEFVGEGNPHTVDAGERGSVTGRLLRISTSSGEILDRIPIGDATVIAAAADAGSVWAIDISNGDLLRLQSG